MEYYLHHLSQEKLSPNNNSYIVSKINNTDRQQFYCYNKRSGSNLKI